MEPRIQYAKTEDGVSIAYWTMGKGDPLVQMPRLPYSHIQMEWHLPEWRAWYERLAEKRMLVRFDVRGTGLSDRDATESFPEALVLDLDAVVDHLGLDRFALIGIHTSGAAAITFAARRPHRVSHLLLWCAYAQGADFFDVPRVRNWMKLVDEDWELFTESASQAGFGWVGGDAAHRHANYMRESITQSAASEAYGALARTDVTGLLPQVMCPTLVMHVREIPYPSVDAARVIASRIPHSSLSILEGNHYGPALDPDPVLQAIDDFLSEGEEVSTGEESVGPGAFRTILFTDVEGSTALTDRLGDAKARELLREHERIVREALKAHGGSEVKTMGDGFMASFASATKALECATAIQRTFSRRNEDADEPIKVRIGLNAGEPIAEDDDLFGASVNRAARIAAMAKGGEILVANVVRELAEGKEFMFGDRGETALRGFDDPVRLFEVRWREDG